MRREPEQQSGVSCFLQNVLPSFSSSLTAETEPAPHSRPEVFSLNVAGEERGLLGGNPTIHQAEEVIFKDQGIDLLGSRVKHGGRLQSVEFPVTAS